MPRGRPKKKVTIKPKNYDDSDLFKLVNNLIERELSDDESQALVKACFSFIRENYSPNQVYDDNTLKEEVLKNDIVTIKDIEIDDWEDNRTDRDNDWGDDYDKY